MNQQTGDLKSRGTAPGVAAVIERGLEGSAGAEDATSARSVRVEASVEASPAEVWRAWTTSEGAQTFLAPQANIQLSIGGPYEIYFNPADERMSTKGMKVLSFSPEEKISFQWNAPGDVPNMPGDGTLVLVELRPECDGATHVTLSHLGWKSAADFDNAVAHFSQGWTEALKRLERRFAHGPIDWQAEAMMWKERQKSAAAP